MEDHPHNNQFTEECLSHCYSQVNYLLHALSKEITGSDDLQDLLTHTIDNNIYPPLDKQHTPFTQFETAFLGGLQQLLGENTQLQITPPNQIASLLHWRILINSFVKLSPQSQKELKTFNPGCPFKDTIQQNHHVIDSHFHLDKMLQVFHKWNLNEIGKQMSTPESPSIIAGIANYVYPHFWLQLETDIANNPNIFYTIGIHPHMLHHHNQYNIGELLKHLENPRCIGIGEIGLDCTTNCVCKDRCDEDQKKKCTQEKIEAQHSFLEILLPNLKNL